MVVGVVTVSALKNLADEHDNPLPPHVVEDRRGRAMLMHEAPLVTVEADPVRVESRLAAGQVVCRVARGRRRRVTARTGPRWGRPRSTGFHASGPERHVQIRRPLDPQPGLRSIVP